MQRGNSRFRFSDLRPASFVWRSLAAERTEFQISRRAGQNVAGRVCIAAIFRCEARLGLEDFRYARHDASECVGLDRGDPGSKRSSR